MLPVKQMGSRVEGLGLLAMLCASKGRMAIGVRSPKISATETRPCVSSGRTVKQRLPSDRSTKRIPHDAGTRAQWKP